MHILLGANKKLIIAMLKFRQIVQLNFKNVMKLLSKIEIASIFTRREVLGSLKSYSFNKVKSLSGSG